MLLAIDIGNSNIVLGVHDTEKWLHKWRIQADIKKMPDEYAVIFRALLKYEEINPKNLDTNIICSVVPHLSGIIAETVQKITGKPALMVNHMLNTGLTIHIDNPAEIGADLLCNAVAAHNKTGKNCIIVDFGTALSFTAVTEKGELTGAAIAPGINAAANALSDRTAQLPKVRLKQPERAIGTDTTTAIQSGIINGYIGMVEHIIASMSREIINPTILATGGSANLIAPYTAIFAVHDPWLILDGLKIIADKNS